MPLLMYFITIVIINNFHQIYLTVVKYIYTFREMIFILSYFDPNVKNEHLQSFKSEQAC